MADWRHSRDDCRAAAASAQHFCFSLRHFDLRLSPIPYLASAKRDKTALAARMAFLRATGLPFLKISIMLATPSNTHYDIIAEKLDASSSIFIAR